MNKSNENKANRMVKTLDTLYDKSLNGLPSSKSIYELAYDYQSKNIDTESAIKSLVKNQILKCGTSGFVTGLGGAITLPIALPANISSVIYIQLRMIATIAYMRGFDPKTDQVKTLAYLCLTGSSMADIVKKSGIKFGEKISMTIISKISGATLTKINQKIGFRFITKAGEKGIINLTKLVPVVGGVIGSGIDIGSTNIIAKNAINSFK